MLWRSESLTGRLGMIGAKAGLRVAPTALPEADVPAVLRGVKGPVCRLDEQVLSPAGFVANLRRRNLDRLLRGRRRTACSFQHRRRAACRRRRSTGPLGRTLTVAPRHVALTAGAGNAELLERTSACPARPAPRRCSAGRCT